MPGAPFSPTRPPQIASATGLKFNLPAGYLFAEPTRLRALTPVACSVPAEIGVVIAASPLCRSGTHRGLFRSTVNTSAVLSNDCLSLAGMSSEANQETRSITPGYSFNQHFSVRPDSGIRPTASRRCGRDNIGRFFFATANHRPYLTYQVRFRLIVIR